jgi:hypothetical protein
MTYLMPEGGVTQLYNDIDTAAVDELRKKWANKPTPAMGAAQQQGDAIAALNSVAPPPTTTPPAGMPPTTPASGIMQPALSQTVAPKISSYGMGQIKQDITKAGEQRDLKLEKAQEKMQESLGKQADAQKYAFDAKADALAAQATLQERQADMQEKSIVQSQASRQAYNEKVNQYQSAVQKEEKMAEYWNTDMTYDEIKQSESLIQDPNVAPEMRAAAKEKLRKAREVDPERVLGSAGKRIGAALAAALGAFGAAFTGGKNYAMDVINGAIQNDINAQRDALKSKKGAVAAKRSELARYQQMFGDEEIAALKLENRKLQAVGMRSDALSKRLGSEQAIASGEQIAAQTQQRIAENDQKIAILQDKAFKEDAQLKGNLAARQVDVAKANAQMQMQADAQNAQKEIAALKAQTKGQGVGDKMDIKGLEKIGETTKEGDKIVRQAFAQQQDFEETLDELIALREKYGSETLPTEAAKKMEALGGKIFNILRAKTGAGAALTPEEIKMMDPSGFIQDPTQFGFGVDAMKAVKDTYKIGFDRLLEKYNYKKSSTFMPSSAKPN